ncbi:MAG: right-handed parallel beta-helix repeat-containing protein [Anaerolineae bacterium]|nr:MAG: right-handed parallel beta-helix repeat-containing protein [Anaerolineae bacterium]
MKRHWLSVCTILVLLFLAACGGAPADPAPAVEDAPADTQPGAAPALPTAQPAAPSGEVSLITVWVDIANGDDAASGATREEALRTLDEAWARIPMGVPLSAGYEIRLAAGEYPEDALPNYLESRHGTATAPIWIVSADGAGTAILRGDLNIYDTHYLTLSGLTIAPDPAGDAFHCELCTHITLTDMTISGGEGREAHETIKINQSQYIDILNSDIQGADDNTIDFVAVQYGNILGNRIHNAGDWCMYAKGGSAYLNIEGNEFFNCGTGGFTAGQGTGFEFMTSPWLHYEAYDIRFVNNIIHDTEGAGFGVNGGYNILFAYNTLYRVGARSHVIEVVYGLRSCDGNIEACQARLDEGGWGTTEIGGEGEPIGNANIYILNNIVYNPAGFQSEWQHFAIYGPRTPAAGSGLPSPVVTDTNLVIQGNVIWNGPAAHPLGMEDGGEGCQPANPTCNPAQLLANNAINTLEPQLADPENGDYRPLEGGNLFGLALASLPQFGWEGLPVAPVPPAGTIANTPVTVDYAQNPRTDGDPPGALAR